MTEDDRFSFASLITSTDAQGNITFANTAFVRACGFDMAQIVGAPHSLVRHPQMPARVFADLWAALKADRPWTGLLCNRSRDGHTFWVKANVIPVHQAGRTVGFTSVQRPAPADEIARAAHVYALWQRGAGRQHVLRHGRIADVGWLALLRALARPLDLPVQRRVQASAGMLALLFAGAVAAALLPDAAGALLAPYGGWRRWAVGAGVLGMLASGAILAYFQTRIVRPLRRSLETASAIAGGEINRHFDDTLSAGELRDLNEALDQLVAKMAAVLRDAHTHSGEVLARLGELSNGADWLAQRSAEQAGNVGAVAERTAASAALSEQVAAAGAGAHDAARATTEAVAEARAMAQTLQGSIDGIARCVGRIVDISAGVDAIATQTGILAMNAAAVAARDHQIGRAFSVIAAEVRALAQRSSEASAQIKGLSEQSQRETARGVELAARLGQTIDATAERVRSVGATVLQIRGAARSQSAGVHEINERLRALDASTRENASLAQRSVQGSAAAMEEADRLRAAIGVWHLDGVPPSGRPSRTRGVR